MRIQYQYLRISTMWRTWFSDEPHWWWAEKSHRRKQETVVVVWSDGEVSAEMRPRQVSGMQKLFGLFTKCNYAYYISNLLSLPLPIVRGNLKCLFSIRNRRIFTLLVAPASHSPEWISKPAPFDLKETCGGFYQSQRAQQKRHFIRKCKLSKETRKQYYKIPKNISKPWVLWSGQMGNPWGLLTENGNRK